MVSERAVQAPCSGCGEAVGVLEGRCAGCGYRRRAVRECAWRVRFVGDDGGYEEEGEWMGTHEVDAQYAPEVVEEVLGRLLDGGACMASSSRFSRGLWYSSEGSMDQTGGRRSIRGTWRAFGGSKSGLSIGVCARGAVFDG